MSLFRLARPNLSLVLLTLIGGLTALSLSCTTRSGLFVSGTNPPAFEIRRATWTHVPIFPLLIVYELHPDNAKLSPIHSDVDKNRILWRIVADPKQSESETIEKIEYGRVPDGFIQELPSNGYPEPFQENRIYEARGALSLMGDAAVRFSVKDGKIIVHPLP